MVMTNNVKGWIGVLMTEDSSSHWSIKRRYVYSETSRRAGLEFVCIFGHDAIETARRLSLRGISGVALTLYPSNTSNSAIGFRVSPATQSIRPPSCAKTRPF